MREVYFIGGGTCSGKSTIAKDLCSRYSLTPYRLDDFIVPYLQKMAEEGDETAAMSLAMGNEKTWMRDPAVQYDEEILLYQGILPIALSAIDALPGERPVLAEGAGFLPGQMAARGVGRDRYICIAPTKAFQLEMYAQRPWIGQYLQDTSDPDRAFMNWMERDVIFSRQVLEEAARLGYTTLLVDGSRSIEENIRQVERCFGLGVTE